MCRGHPLTLRSATDRMQPSKDPQGHTHAHTPLLVVSPSLVLLSGSLFPFWKVPGLTHSLAEAPGTHPFSAESHPNLRSGVHHLPHPSSPDPSSSRPCQSWTNQGAHPWLQGLVQPWDLTHFRPIRQRRSAGRLLGRPCPSLEVSLPRTVCGHQAQNCWGPSPTSKPQRTGSHGHRGGLRCSPSAHPHRALRMPSCGLLNVQSWCPSTDLVFAGGLDKGCECKIPGAEPRGSRLVEPIEVMPA